MLKLLKKDLINIPMVYALYSAYNIIITKLLNFSKNYDNLGTVYATFYANHQLTLLSCLRVGWWLDRSRRYL